MRRSGVRIPSAHPPQSRPTSRNAESSDGVLALSPLTHSVRVPPACPWSFRRASPARSAGRPEVVQVEVRRGSLLVAHLPGDRLQRPSVAPPFAVGPSATCTAEVCRFPRSRRACRRPTPAIDAQKTTTAAPAPSAAAPMPINHGYTLRQWRKPTHPQCHHPRCTQPRHRPHQKRQDRQPERRQGDPRRHLAIESLGGKTREQQGEVALPQPLRPRARARPSWPPSHSERRYGDDRSDPPRPRAPRRSPLAGS